MGILKDYTKSDNILLANGFTRENKSVTGDLIMCYEKVIFLNSCYVAWVSVDIETSQVYVYIEYECGGGVAKFDNELDTDFYVDQESFFRELDDYVTDTVSSYR